MSANIIKINRGDCYSFMMSIEDESDPNNIYEFQPNDILYFALLNPHDRFEDAIILRGYTYADAKEVSTSIGTVHLFEIALSRDDTKNLAPGVYYYTFKLQKNAKSTALAFNEPNAQLTTVIERTKLIINE